MKNKNIIRSVQLLIVLFALGCGKSEPTTVSTPTFTLPSSTDILAKTALSLQGSGDVDENISIAMNSVWSSLGQTNTFTVAPGSPGNARLSVTFPDSDNTTFRGSGPYIYSPGTTAAQLTVTYSFSRIRATDGTDTTEYDITTDVIDLFFTSATTGSYRKVTQVSSGSSKSTTGIFTLN